MRQSHLLKSGGNNFTFLLGVTEGRTKPTLPIMHMPYKPFHPKYLKVNNNINKMNRCPNWDIWIFCIIRHHCWQEINDG